MIGLGLNMGHIRSRIMEHFVHFYESTMLKQHPSRWWSILKAQSETLNSIILLHKMVLKPETFCAWEYNCRVTWIDKQRRRCDRIHLTLYSALSRQWPRLSRGAVWMCVSVSRCVCVCVFERTTQVFSPRPPRYHQSLSSSFIKRCRCTWAR